MSAVRSDEQEEGRLSCTNKLLIFVDVIWKWILKFFYSKLFDPASRQHSWFVCPLWVWLCSTFMNPLTHPWRFAPTPCSGCPVGASQLELPSHFLSARSRLTLRPSTSAVSLSRWASLEPPVCWRFVSYKKIYICEDERSVSFLILLYIIRSAFLFFTCRVSSGRMIPRKWRFKCSSWCMAHGHLKTRVELTSSCLMAKQRYSLRCSLASQKFLLCDVPLLECSGWDVGMLQHL